MVGSPFRHGAMSEDFAMANRPSKSTKILRHFRDGAWDFSTSLLVHITKFVGIVILVMTVPITLTWNVFYRVHLDIQAIYGGTLGALIGIGLDRLVSGNHRKEVCSCAHQHTPPPSYVANGLR